LATADIAHVWHLLQKVDGDGLQDEVLSLLLDLGTLVATSCGSLRKTRVEIRVIRLTRMGEILPHRRFYDVGRFNKKYIPKYVRRQSTDF
jgi:hypothetical protein